jgi:hypothetical protein
LLAAKHQVWNQALTQQADLKTGPVTHI